MLNVKTRNDFEMFLDRLKAAKIVVWDNETTGLKLYKGDRMISMSFHFPEFGLSYNLAFRHGSGKFTDSVPALAQFVSMKWNDDRKKAYMQHFWARFAASKDWGNLPLEWLDEIKDIWGKPGVRYIGHNVKFDLTVQANEGWQVPDVVEDTMVNLAVVFEDWGGVNVKMPNGQKQRGNRQLKWQGEFWNLPNARVGEGQLKDAAQQLELDFATWIAHYALDDPYNTGLTYKRKKTESDFEYAERHIARIVKKIKINPKAQMWALHPDDVAYYAVLDTELTWQLREKLQPMIESWGQAELTEKLNAVNVKVSWVMERTGFRVDVPTAQAEIARLQPEMDALNRHFVDASGNPQFKIGSPKQLAAFLTDKIPGSAWYREDKKPNKDTGELETVYAPLTGKPFLDRYADNEWIRTIFEYRKLQKAVKSYLMKWVNAADANGILHPSFDVVGTATGRWASSGDGGNFQNIPDRAYTIKTVLHAFDDEWLLIGADYGQLEARLAAWVAEVLCGLDPNQTMTSKFNSGEDLHAFTRDMLNVRQIVFGDMTSEEIVTARDRKLQPGETFDDAAADICRQIAKTCNFGLLYSGGKRMLAKQLKIDIDAAAVLVEKWHELFPAFRRANTYFAEVAMDARANPTGSIGKAGKGFRYVQQPITGRTRKFDLYETIAFKREKDGTTVTYNPREKASKKAFNAIIQGLAGLITALSMLKMVETFGLDVVRPVANIHDAAYLYVRRDRLDVVPALWEIMSDWDTTPRLVVDAKAFPVNWQEGHKIGDMALWISSQGKEGYKKKK